MDKTTMSARYFITIIASFIAGWLVDRGYITVDQVPGFKEAVVAVVLAIGAFGPYAWAWWNRPSAKALEAAKEIDAKLPASADVVIKTPVGVPDIKVSAK